MNPALIITGAAVLLLGRQLFWLFVAVVGFTLGLTWTQTMLAQQPLWVAWAVGLAAGAAGAILAILVQKLAVAVGGFLAGIHIAAGLSAMAGHQLNVPIGLFAGVLGALVLFFFFDWALIALSSAAGALLIVNGIAAAALLQWILFCGLAIVGMLCQIVIWRRRPAGSKKIPS